MSTILLTRPIEDSEAMKIKLEVLGYDCLIAPMLKVESTKATHPHKADAVVATSRHAFSDQDALDDTPLYVVGKQTAKIATESGWPTPKHIAQTSDELIKALTLPEKSSILYLRGEHVSADLATALPQYDWKEVITYRAKPQRLEKKMLEKLKDGKIDCVLFFSKRSAKHFEAAITDQDIPPLDAVCLSQAVADTLKLPCWERKQVADHPSEAALIESLRSIHNPEMAVAKTRQNAIADGMSDEPHNEESETSESKSHRHVWLYAVIAVLVILQLATIAHVVRLSKQLTAKSPITESGMSDEFKESLNVWFEDVQNEIDILHESLNVLDEKARSAKPSDDAVSWQEQYDDIQKRVAKLEERPIPSEQMGPVMQFELDRITAMAEQLKQMKSEIDARGEAQWRNIQLLTSFDRLEERVMSHESYSQALGAFRIAAANIPESALWVRSLSKLQYDGMPSLKDLAAQFDAAREVTLSPSDGNDETTWDEVKANLSQLVTIRKTGPVHTGNDVESIMARAEYALQQQEYEVMEDEINKLPEEKQAYFADLLDAIEQRAAAMETIATIRTHIAAMIEAR